MISHTADLGMEFYGTSKEELFISAGEGLFYAICDSEEVRCEESFNIKVDGVDMEDLMVNWLREFLYLHHIKFMLINGFKIVEFHGESLVAEVRGEKFDEKRHAIKNEIKAATYHGLEVKEADGLWTARVIFDV